MHTGCGPADDMQTANAQACPAIVTATRESGCRLMLTGLCHLVLAVRYRDVPVVIIISSIVIMYIGRTGNHDGKHFLKTLHYLDTVYAPWLRDPCLGSDCNTLPWVPA